MPQMILPLFPEGATTINELLSFGKQDGQIIYFHGVMPVFIHAADDVASFRMITAQFCVNGNAKQIQIVKAFGVTPISVKRAVKVYREKGAAGFFQTRRTRGAAVLSEPVLRDVQQRLDSGESTKEIAQKLGLKKNTLDKAIRDGRLHKQQPTDASVTDPPSADACTDSSSSPSSKSERNTSDSQAEMGMGATNMLDRVAARVGLLQQVSIEFQSSLDVSHGGVLLAIPALLACGLLRYTDQHFQLPKGYYGIKSIFLLLATMALCRFKSVEQLRYVAPGEWGKLLGLDRVPEVRTLREKIALLANQNQASSWNAALSQDWMQQMPEQVAAFCVDGHVRVYHGQQTELPKHYVARQKLCLRATTDYWVNALDGRPFFLINKAVDVRTGNGLLTSGWEARQGNS